VATLIVVFALGFVLWVAFNRPTMRTGGWNGQRVYLRRGPGLGGIALAVIALVYLSDHAGNVATELLIGMGVAIMLLVMYFGVRHFTSRGK
jgi:hypothetical protein